MFKTWNWPNVNDLYARLLKVFLFYTIDSFGHLITRPFRVCQFIIIKFVKDTFIQISKVKTSHPKMLREIKMQGCQIVKGRNSWLNRFVKLCYRLVWFKFNSSQLAKMKKSIPRMSLP